MRARYLLQLLAFVFAACACGCEEKVAPVIDASPPPPPPPPQREGCARVGAMEGIETDQSCAIRRVEEDAMRGSMKRLSVTVAIEPPEVFASSSGLVTVTIKNASSVETLVLLEARTRLPGPRTDWSRVVGVPEPHPVTTETPKLFFPMTTTDSRDRDVDALPTVAGSATATAPPGSPLGVHLRPGGKLTHTFSWWALRIPAPAPIFQDDAGHRYIPKTSALALDPGEYNIVLELPLYGLTREERKFSARVRVTKAPKLDAGPS